MSVAACDVCFSPILPIVWESIPSYLLTVSIDSSVDPLPPHLRNMRLQGYSPVVRCNSCGLEDEVCNKDLFENMAYLKAFQALSHSVTLRYLRDHFAMSRQTLADKIGYESGQSIYRIEKSNEYVQKNTANLIISATLDMIRSLSGQAWHISNEFWREIEYTSDMRIIVPLPMKLLLNTSSPRVRNAV